MIKYLLAGAALLSVSLIAGCGPDSPTGGGATALLDTSVPATAAPEPELTGIDGVEAAYKAGDIDKAFLLGGDRAVQLEALAFIPDKRGAVQELLRENGRPI